MSGDQHHPSIVRFLSDPAAYPHGPERVEHIQTHISDVFMAGELVYKLKKPVDMGFVDYTTLELRRHFCELEVELNSRLSDIYLGTVPITFSGGAYQLGGYGKGVVVDYVVEMRRLDDAGFLKTLLERGEITREDMLGVVAKLAAFYEAHPTTPAISAYGELAAIRRNIEDNLSLIGTFTATTITRPAFEAVSRFNDTFFERCGELFARRTSGGWIRDCHGDLHLEHIHLAAGKVNIFDCIEFNPRFRFIDIASETAFLSMDLDYNGHPGEAALVAEEMARRLGDGEMWRMLDFYKCYRAFVRGKVESIRSAESEVPQAEREEAALRAGRYFTLGLMYALVGSGAVLVVTFGNIGSGKSTLAGGIARELGCEVFSSDVVRKELAGLAPTERRYEGFTEGIYSPAMTEKTYAELLARAASELEGGRVVVADASFSRRWQRALALETASKCGARCVFILVDAPVSTLRERLIEREMKGVSVSDGRLEILDEWLARFEPPDELPPGAMVKAYADADAGNTLLGAFHALSAHNVARVA